MRASGIISFPLTVVKLSAEEKRRQPDFRLTPLEAVYTIANYDLNAFNQMLYEQLNRQILNISADVTREFKKLYIAYKLDTNFVDIVVGKDYLQLYINLNFDEVNDPKEKCENVTQTGHHGNGNISIRVAHADEIDYAMNIIQQAYDKQVNS